MKHIMKISNTNVNKIVIKMLNKHENPSEVSKSKRKKKQHSEYMMNILNTDAQKHNKRTKQGLKI